MGTRASVRMWLGSLVVGATACVGPPSGPPELPYTLSRPVSSGDFEIPDRFSDFFTHSVEAYEEPALGIRVHLQVRDHPEVRADLFAYPIALPELFSLSQILDLEQRKLEEEIGHVVARSGAVVSPARVTAHSPRPGGMLLPGLRGERDIIDGRNASTSYSFLSVNHDLFFKLRLTVPGETAGAIDFDRFIDEISAHFRVRSPSARPLGVTITRTTLELASDDSACVLAAWILYGVTLQKSLARGEYLDTFEREREAREALVAYWRDRPAATEEDECVSPALSALALAHDAGFVSEYVWTAFRLPYWEQPAGLEIEAYQEWAETALDPHDPIRFPGVLITWSEGADP